MAASAKSGYSEDEGELVTDINVTPLVDVTLVLLIVFMITMPALVASSPIKVNLPESTSAAMEAVEQLPLNIFVKRGETGEIELFVNETRTTEESLTALVKSIRIPGVDQPVHLSADKSIAYGEVIKVMDMLKSIGLNKISLATKHVSSQ